MVIWSTEQEIENNLTVDLRVKDCENGKLMKLAKARQIVSNSGLWYYQCRACVSTGFPSLHINLSQKLNIANQKPQFDAGSVCRQLY
jgi:hypothetical protein